MARRKHKRPKHIKDWGMYRRIVRLEALKHWFVIMLTCYRTNKRDEFFNENYSYWKGRIEGFLDGQGIPGRYRLEFSERTINDCWKKTLKNLEKYKEKLED